MFKEEGASPPPRLNPRRATEIVSRYAVFAIPPPAGSRLFSAMANFHIDGRRSPPQHPKTTPIASNRVPTRYAAPPGTIPRYACVWERGS